MDCAANCCQSACNTSLYKRRVRARDTKTRLCSVRCRASQSQSRLMRHPQEVTHTVWRMRWIPGPVRLAPTATLSHTKRAEAPPLALQPPSSGEGCAPWHLLQHKGGRAAPFSPSPGARPSRVSSARLDTRGRSSARLRGGGRLRFCSRSGLTPLPCALLHLYYVSSYSRETSLRC